MRGSGCPKRAHNESKCTALLFFFLRTTMGFADSGDDNDDDDDDRGYESESSEPAICIFPLSNYTTTALSLFRARVAAFTGTCAFFIL